MLDLYNVTLRDPLPKRINILAKTKLKIEYLLPFIYLV